MPDDENRSIGKGDHPMTDAAEEQATKVGEAAGADRDQVGTVLLRRQRDLRRDPILGGVPQLVFRVNARLCQPATTS
jgi:hypothetical protein